MATQLKDRSGSPGAASANRARYDRKQLCHLLTTRTLKRGSFQLASGRISPVYFNVKATMMHPVGAALCARGLQQILGDLTVDYIGGLEMGAVPLLSVVSAFSAEDNMPLPSFFVRKTPKAHGTQLKIEGLDDMGGETLNGHHVVLIDDVATSGGSILQAVDEIKAAGGIVTDAIVILDREEGATERLAKHGIKLHALFTATNLGVTDEDRRPLD